MRSKSSRYKVLYLVILILLLGVGTYFMVIKMNPGINRNSEHTMAPESIAILPFVNADNDSSQQYLSDGLTDDILNSLSKLKGVRVTAPASSFVFRHAHADIKNVGERLNVNTVLQGSLELTGNHVRIKAWLTNVADGVNIWTQEFEDNMEDIFNLQDKIVKAIIDNLKIKFPEIGSELVPEKSIKTEAYEFYLKGRLSWNQGSPPELKKGINYFQQAITIDTSYAAAYAGIADCYTALGYGSFLAPKDAFPKALEAATKAIELDSTLADAHASLGFYKFYYDWDWAAAEQEFRTAIALNPNYALGYDWYGYYLTAMKRYDEARTVFSKAAELDPLSVRVSTDMGFSVYYSGDYDLAIKKLQGALQINPDYPLALIWLGRSYQAKKMYTEAIAEYTNALKHTSDWPVAFAQIGNVYGVAGNKTEALEILDTLNSLSSKKYVTSYGVALVYVGLGENDQAFSWLNKAYDERSHWLVWLRSDPRWLPLESDKRYADLVNKVGLPQ